MLEHSARPVAALVGDVLRDWDPVHLTGLVSDESTYDEVVPTVLAVLAARPTPLDLAERLRAVFGVRFRVRPPLAECEQIALELLRLHAGARAALRPV